MTTSVVDLREVEPGIVQLTMQERAHKNTFSEELMHGLFQAFESIRTNMSYKAVILTGYDTYFASGGTQEGLMAIYKGEAKFTDSQLYSLPLECEIPVIAAMQGHGIGGGFILGLFCDFVVLGRENMYTANFMKYGFTPGMGATCILPKKLGISLAQEFLLLAGNHRGAELEKRGVPFPVVPRAEVLNRAYQIARELADKPRISLITLKDHLVEPIKKQLPDIIEKEVAMHEKSFHQPEVKERILKLFGQ